MQAMRSLAMTTPTTSRVTDAQREAFEDWAQNLAGYDVKPSTTQDGCYHYLSTQRSWQGWQAALTRLGDVVAVGELRDVIRKKRIYAGHLPKEHSVIEVDDLSAILNRGGK
jgi:hypothetical protein